MAVLIVMGLNESQMERNRVLTEDFTKLYLELKDEGLFEPSYLHILLRIVDVFVLGIVGYSLLWSRFYSIKIIGMILLGLSLGRCGWIQHECGHNSISGNPKIDRFLHVIFMGDFSLKTRLLKHCIGNKTFNCNRCRNGTFFYVVGKTT